jgi:hypothetical protein
MTTSTVYTTKVHTVTSCAASVTDCPGGSHVTTETSILYTTVCPVSETEAVSSTYQSSAPVSTLTTTPKSVGTVTASSKTTSSTQAVVTAAAGRVAGGLGAAAAAFVVALL